MRNYRIPIPLTVSRVVLSGIFGIILIYSAACSGDQSLNSEPEDFPASDLSWLLHIRPVLLNNCAVPECHNNASQQNGLDLEADPPSFQSNTRLVVIPFNRTSSLLYEVLFQQTDDIPRMPRNGAALSNAKRAAIGTWIDEGANTAN